MSAVSRKFFVGGNWKMNGDFASIDGIIAFMKSDVVAKNATATDIVVAPPALYMTYVRDQLKCTGVQLAAQNCYRVASGAFTGELSPAMIKDVGARWAIIGHSERRHVFGESDALIADKTAHALQSGIGVILCIGEKLDERESEKTKEVCYRQLQAIVDKNVDWTNIVVAYEPVWAIGTGKTATPDQAQQAHVWVREFLREKVSTTAADATRIIYGGSVTADNACELGKLADIDGFLVGGASLKPDFVKIINARA